MKYRVSKHVAFAGALFIATPVLAYLAQSFPEGPVHTSACVHYAVSKSGQQTHIGYAEYPMTNFEYEHGMKHRMDLSPDDAMIFDMGDSRNVSFWMKNTPSALDMLFFGPDGKMLYGTEAEPLSEELISAPGNPSIRFVMELPAGRAKEIDLQAGISHLSVSKPIPCAEISA